MSNEDTQVVDSAETTTIEEESLEDNTSDNDSTGEDEAAAKTEGGEQQSTETPEQRKARLTRQAKRIKKQLAEFGEESSEEGEKSSNQKSHQEEGSKIDDERYARLELKTEGITSKKAQDIVIEYAEWKGIDVSDALKSPIVKAEIAELAKKTSAPPPSKRTGSGASNSFEYWVSQAKKGNFPTGDKEMMRKLQKARIFTS